MTPEERLVQLQQLNANLYFQAGLLANDWAMLEFKVNECIWRLANVNIVAGGCLTSYIFTMANRLTCLLSLMRLRGIKEDTVSKVNAFSQRMHGTAEKRNRTIHDPIVLNMNDGSAGQIEITARNKPVFRIKAITLEDLKAVRSEVLDRFNEFMTCRDQIFSQLPTLPEIPAPESDPTLVTLTLQK